MYSESTVCTEVARPNAQSHPVEPVAKPGLEALVSRISRDSRQNAEEYLNETEVPHGGE
jgi:hypothetical protein